MSKPWYKHPLQTAQTYSHIFTSNITTLGNDPYLSVIRLLYNDFLVDPNYPNYVIYQRPKMLNKSTHRF